MITTNAAAVQQSLLKARTEIENKLKAMVVGFAKDVASSATANTPLGDSETYAKWYASRYKSKGYLPVEGLAQGNWQYTTNGSAVFVPNYGTASNESAVNEIVAEARSSYKVGDTFYISNSLDYISRLEDNSSEQTNGQGIMKPTVDSILAMYKIDLKSNYDSGSTTR